MTYAGCEYVSDLNGGHHEWLDEGRSLLPSITEAYTSSSEASTVALHTLLNSAIRNRLYLSFACVYSSNGHFACIQKVTLLRDFVLVLHHVPFNP